METYKKPNIIVFMTDQQRGCTLEERSPVKTPNFDILRKKGMLLSNSYCVSPHCCPSRASFFSSLYPTENGVWNNVLVDNTLSRGLFDGVTLFPEILQKNGYHTMFSGKWHVSAYENPIDRGFNEETHVTAGKDSTENRNTGKFTQWEKSFSNSLCIAKRNPPQGNGALNHTGYPNFNLYGVKENPFGDNDTLEAAVELLKKEQEKQKTKNEPYFLYVGALGPHDPYTPPQRFLDMYKDLEIELPDNFIDKMDDKPGLYKRTQDNFKMSKKEHIDSLRRYYAFCSYEDYIFGELVKNVDDIKNTYIFYISDHGDYCGSHKLWTKGLPCFSEAYDICSFVMGPGIKTGTSTNKVTILDFAPTILEMAKITIPENMKGYSILPLLKGENTKEVRSEFYTQTNGNEVYGIQRAIWNDEWKFVMNFYDYDELYNLKKDPGELHNLIYTEKGRKKYDSIIYSLSKKIWKFAIKNHDTTLNPYIMISLPQYGPGICLDE